MLNLISVVDQNDRIIGYEDKIVVHQRGVLHRAFSVLVFNRQGEMLLQRRALNKYHSAGLWTNTCCSHLPQGVDMEQFVHTRLVEEMGFDCEMDFVTKFHYHVDFGDGMIENEIDHIYLGYFDGLPKPNPDEVCEWAWFSKEFVLEDIERQPEKYTYWFKNILKNHLDLIKIGK